jgi:hypothetical protein
MYKQDVNLQAFLPGLSLLALFSQTDSALWSVLAFLR